MNSFSYIRTFFLWTVLPLFTFSCDDTTGTLGSGIMPDEDGLQISQATYKVFTRSLKADSVLATTDLCYLGRVTDPETNATTTGDFLAQFYLQDNYKFPHDSMMVKAENGKIEADSVTLQLYVSSYYGDSLNSLKIGIYDLDTLNVMKENESYYTNINPEQYVNKAPNAIRKEQTVSIKGLNESVSSDNQAYRNIQIKLPREYGTFIINQYYKNPDYFKNSFNFIRHVCPGFYIKTLSGNGIMFSIDVSTLSIYFRYKMNDSIYNGVNRIAATEEVIQNTHVENKNLDPLLNEKAYTYLKTPSGIFTEVTLPIDSIYHGEHANDTVNSAKLIFTRQNNESGSLYNLEIPTNILMVPKKQLYTFFEERKVADGIESYVTTFNREYNSYTFNNISQLIVKCQNNRKQGAGIQPEDSPQTCQNKYQIWEKENPDWNKVVLVPVTTTYNSSGTLSRVRNDLGLKSVKLSGGDTGNISISIVYSRFNK